MQFKYAKIGRMIKDKIAILEFVNREKDYLVINTTDKQIEQLTRQYKITNEDIKFLYGCFDKNAKVHAIKNNTLLRMHDFRAYSILGEENVLKEVDILDDVLTSLTMKFPNVAVVEEVVEGDTKDYKENITTNGNKFYTKTEKSKVLVVISY